MAFLNPSLSLALFFSTMVVSCTGPSPAVPAPVPKDSPIVNTRRPLDSPSKRSSAANVKADGFQELDLKQVLADYLKECKDTVKLDAQVAWQGKDFHIFFRHYSTNDSLIQIPKQFLTYYGLKKFITSDFESFLKIKAGDSVLLDTIIRSNIFHRYGGENLSANGALFYGGMKFIPGYLTIDYSYSIPLTDVGIPVRLEYPFGRKLIAKGGY